MALKCGGCQQIITTRKLLTCTFCKESYDLECSGVSIQRFLNTLTPDHREKWKCRTCCSKIPKTKIPIPRQRTPSEEHVTIRNKTTSKYNLTLNRTLSQEDLSLLGDTLEKPVRSPTPITQPEKDNIFSQLELFLDKKLDSIKNSIIHDIKHAIICELKAELDIMKTETNKKIESVRHEQDKITNNNKVLDKRIINLEEQTQKIRLELQELKRNQKNITNLQPPKSLNPNPTSTKNKHIVLYGVKQNGWENMQDLHNYVLCIFHDILNIDLSGQIEDIRKMGKKGTKGPITVELLSKNITNYILANTKYLKNVGITVTSYLDEEALKVRKQLVQILIDARKKGHRSNIINNKLYIDGQEYMQNTNITTATENDLMFNNSNMPQDYPNDTRKIPEITAYSPQDKTFFR